MNAFNIEKIRKDFPLLDQSVNGYPLAYLDNAATTQKPRAVLEALQTYYAMDNANVHRGLHSLSLRATNHYEEARATIARFINADSLRECIFVRNTTEAINLVASSFVADRLQMADEILITHMEHHSNIVPWQMLCERTGAVLRIAPISLSGELLLEEFENRLNARTKFVAISHASNAIGTINPVKEMIAMAKKWGVPVLVDGAQAIAHLPVDVADLGCDFYAFSGHKVYGPTGIGILWAKEKLLDKMPPYQGGGEMINAVSFDKTEYASLPYKFEAGTPNIAGAIGLGAAVDYFAGLDREAIAAYEAQLLDYTTTRINDIKGFNIVGTAAQKLPIVSFVHGTIHAHDIGTILDNMGIAVRSGHHCAMPLMDFFDVAATSRISLAFYNTMEEIDRAVHALRGVKEIFV